MNYIQFIDGLKNAESTDWDSLVDYINLLHSEKRKMLVEICELRSLVDTLHDVLDIYGFWLLAESASADSA